MTDDRSSGQTDAWGNPLPEQPTDWWGGAAQPSTPAPPPGPPPGAYNQPPGAYGAPPGPPGQPPGTPGQPPGPVGYGPGQPGAYGQPPGYQAYQGPPKTDPKAIWSLVCALVGLLICGVILGPVAIGLGIAARTSIRNSFGARKGDGLAITGLVLGIVTTLISVVLLVIFVSDPTFMDEFQRQLEQ